MPEEKFMWKEDDMATHAATMAMQKENMIN